VFALRDSISLQTNEFVLHVLVIDETPPQESANIKFYELKHLSSNQASRAISRYGKKADALRWTMKPLFMRHLLHGHESVIYVDNDVAFYSSPEFLFKELNNHSILLTPHDYEHSPYENQNWLEANFKIGLYNAGFIGASIDAKAALEWWAECCIYRCEKSYWRGLYDDQKYLDLMPILDRNTKVLDHKGCNVAGWNRNTSCRTTTNGITNILDLYEIVFIHFNYYTIRMIIEGKDEALKPHWQQYFELLKKYRGDLKENHLYTKDTLSEKIRLGIWKLLEMAR
jgi:hypothetical protein